MADVERKCTHCGRLVTVSAVAEGFVCPECGTAVTLASAPQAEAVGVAGQKPKLRVREEIGACVEKAEEPHPQEEGFLGRRSKPKPIPCRPKNRTGPSNVVSAHLMGSWLLFFVVGGCMAGCRYGGWLNESQLETLRMLSPIVLLALYVTTLLTVFTDSVFSGILSLLLPPYSLYHLLAVSERFLLRALVVGLLVGTGQYSAEFIAFHWTRMVTAVHAYILSGG